MCTRCNSERSVVGFGQIAHPCGECSPRCVKCKGTGFMLSFFSYMHLRRELERCKACDGRGRLWHSEFLDRHKGIAYDLARMSKDAGG